MMTEVLKKQVLIVKENYEELKKTTSENRIKLLDQIKEVVNYIDVYDKGWAGDWSENSDLYYEGFYPNASTGMHVDERFIKNDLKENTGIDIDKVLKLVVPISKKFYTLKDFIITELLIINDSEELNNESNIILQIENFTWGISRGDYIKSRRPSYIYVEDPFVINNGLQVPPHIKIADDIFYLFSTITAFDNFDTLVNRLIRQIEIKSTLDTSVSDILLPKQNLIISLIEKFHTVVMQLRNRYDGRDTIIVKDEYDVQDIMNALLRINFDDVRKEENTPTYAGGSTRVDFLLKREKILIEVKKTRSTLKDKEVGNQLLLDIAHYKSHPDCKHLICFVYDPENLITNPRGLEDDLNRNSSEEMIVEVYIRP